MHVCMGLGVGRRTQALCSPGFGSGLFALLVWLVSSRCWTSAGFGACVYVCSCARVCPCSQYDRVAGSLADRRAAKGRGPDREYTEEEMEAMRAKAEKERNQVMMNVRGEPRIAG